MKKVIVIVGPTGSGKTGLSIQLAKTLSKEIINGDSVQVYKGLDIGSAKIKEAEKQGVPHHLLDVISPEENYSVYQFQKDVRHLLDKLDTPIIVGGTGLYIKAALYNYEFTEQKRDDHFEQEVSKLTNEALYEQLIKLDPDIKIEPNNRRRVLRALSLAQSGQLRSKKTKKDEMLYDACILYLDLDRDVLEKRLHERLDMQLQEGFIEEVKSLRDKNIKINAIGYREIDQYLEGHMTLNEAKEHIVLVSRKLAKKQKTFFKNQMHPIMLDALSPHLFESAMAIINAWLKE